VPLIGIAAEIVQALNPSVGALFHYFRELPGNWLFVVELGE
jgi:hypothetical protein